MAKIYLSLGSNIGDKHKFLNDALKSLEPHIKLQEISSLYQTAPWGKTDQPAFLNMCVAGETSLLPLELLSFTKSIETQLGRTRTEKWGPREIDIDMLFYDDEVIKSPGLEVPHPHLSERAFVLIPLAEIAPEFKHPVLDKSMAALAESIDSSGVTKVKE